MLRQSWRSAAGVAHSQCRSCVILDLAARVERLVEWVPVWSRICHARLRRLILAWQGLGIVAVGRAGTFTPMDPGTEVGLVHRYANERVPDQREALRALLEPPVRTDDLDISPGVVLSA